MKVGDKVYTPRFCTVTIKAVFDSSSKAWDAGYKESSHFDKDPEYEILGKHLGENRMEFAAVRK